jgi:hypothetical protein
MSGGNVSQPITMVSGFVCAAPAAGFAAFFDAGFESKFKKKPFFGKFIGIAQYLDFTPWPAAE